MAFEMASTNLVLELSIILIVLMGWQFMAAEAIAAPIMIAILAVFFRPFLRPQLLQAAKDQAEKGIAGRMEGHAEMDISVPAEGSLWRRIPESQWKSIRTTNAIERLHEEFTRRIKTQTVLPSAETAAMLFWALLASGQIVMRKVDGWPSLSQKPSDQIIDLAA